jgi:Arc/MetJ-type ribon-helix-helix transcriptional regulator
MAKIMISLPDNFLNRVDRKARETHRSRSELVREALRAYMEGERMFVRPIENPLVREAYEHLLKHPIRWKGRLDSTGMIRKMRDTRYGK